MLSLRGCYAGHPFAAGRLSYVLGLNGVCEAIDVACSAALVACHNACRAQQAHDAADALVAGVNMMFIPATLDAFTAAGLTSPSGKSFVFDARANGFVRGEGCGAGVVQTATKAPEVVAGSAVRQDGRSASLTAPSGRAQQILLRAVLADATTTSMQLQLVEAAANGSALGDPIEAGAIAGALLVERGQSDALTVGSIKANLGHTESASGVMGMTKLLCVLRRAQAASNAQLSVLAEHVVAAWRSAPGACVLPSQLVEMSALSLMGTVSSFGLGGTIASAVLRVTALGGDGGASTFRWLKYRRRSSPWRQPLRAYIAWRGAISGACLSNISCTQCCYAAMADTRR
jgi:acyl transferase domain-containing protein